MRRFRRLLWNASLLSLLVVAPAFGQQFSIDGIQVSPGNFDPIGPNWLSVASTQLAVNAQGTTAATPATLPAVAGKTNYVCGFEVDGDATAVGTGSLTLSGMANTLSFFYSWTATGSGVTSMVRVFFPCLAASAANTAITVTPPALGTGGIVDVNIWGFVR